MRGVNHPWLNSSMSGRSTASTKRSSGGICGSISKISAQQPTVRQFQGGQSNPTFLIETPGGKYVLRKQPPGKLLPSAHAVDREFRVQSALKGSPVPVVRMRLFCEDASIIGTPFYLMDYIPGRIFMKPDLPDLDHMQRKTAYHAFAETLAALHEVDFRALGLGDYGRTEGYAARQLKRWSEQYQASKTREIEAMDRLIAWLKASVPVEDEAAITHGDYRIGNIMFEVDAPHIIAVLDWELSTLGHPLADLGYVCMTYRIPAHMTLLSGLARPRSARARHPNRGGACGCLLPPRRPRQRAGPHLFHRAVVLPLCVHRARRLRALAAGQRREPEREPRGRGGNRARPGRLAHRGGGGLGTAVTSRGCVSAGSCVQAAAECAWAAT